MTANNKVCMSRVLPLVSPTLQPASSPPYCPLRGWTGSWPTHFKDDRTHSFRQVSEKPLGICVRLIATWTLTIWIVSDSVPSVGCCLIYIEILRYIHLYIERIESIYRKNLHSIIVFGTRIFAAISVRPRRRGESSYRSGCRAISLISYSSYSSSTIWKYRCITYYEGRGTYKECRGRGSSSLRVRCIPSNLIARWLPGTTSSGSTSRDRSRCISILASYGTRWSFCLLWCASSSFPAITLTSIPASSISCSRFVSCGFIASRLTSIKAINRVSSRAI